jgi:hypothetical protein
MGGIMIRFSRVVTKKFIIALCAIAALTLAAVSIRMLMQPHHRVWRMAIVIDRDNERDMCSAITDDLKHLIAQQATPILVIGSHLFENIVQGYQHCCDEKWCIPKSHTTIDLHELFELTRKLRSCLYGTNGYVDQQAIASHLQAIDTTTDILLDSLAQKHIDAFHDDFSSFCTLHKIGAPEQYEYFDRNWLVYRVRLHTPQEPNIYLLIPRRYLEYMYDINLGTSVKPHLDDVIDEMIKHKKIYSGNGTPCTNLTDVLAGIGIASNIQLEQFYLETYTHQSPESCINEKDWQTIVTTTINSILKPAPHKHRWCIRICGHGCASDDQTKERVIDVPKGAFVELITTVLAPKNIGALSISSCYAGGEHRTWVEQCVPWYKDHHLAPIIILESSTDAATLNMCPIILRNAEIAYLVDHIATTNNARDICLWNPLPYRSTPHNDDLFSHLEATIQGNKSQLTGAYQQFVTRTLITHNNYAPESIPVNYPQYLDLTVTTHFEPLASNDKMHIITADKSSNDAITIHNKECVWLMPSTLTATLVLHGTVPCIIPWHNDDIVHECATIDARACPGNTQNIETFCSKFFAHKDMCHATPKNFFIKKLLLPAITYTNIYATLTDTLITISCHREQEKVSSVFAYRDDAWQPYSTRKLSRKDKRVVSDCIAKAEHYTLAYHKDSV